MSTLFTPTLPVLKTRAIDAIGYETLEKVFIIFDKQFWVKGVNEIGLVRPTCNHNNEITTLDDIFWAFIVYPFCKNVLYTYITGEKDCELLRCASDEDVCESIQRVCAHFTCYSNVRQPLRVIR
jgi:hypothetical protein